MTKVDIDASKLTYTPPANANGDDYATFQFKVNDGTDDSATASTMTINVTAVNDAATGQPAITGIVQVGQVLTAAVGTIADPDGLPDPFLTDANTSFQCRVTSGTDDDISGQTCPAPTPWLLPTRARRSRCMVSFQDGGGGSEGPLTSVATAVVNAADTVPGAPTLLSATASGTSQINLTWTAPASTGGSAITGYKIEVSPDGLSTTWTDQVANTNDANTTYAHTGLQAGITRYYRVSAINATATGPVSNTDSATTASDGTVQNFLLNFGTNFSHTVVVRESRDVNHLLTLNLRKGPYDPPNGDPKQPVTIPLVVTHQGGATEADYVGLPATVTFGVGKSVAAFNLRAIQDQIRETGEGLRIDFGELPRGRAEGRERGRTKRSSSWTAWCRSGRRWTAPRWS